MKTSIFVTASDNDVIGRNGQIPWHIAESSRRFMALIRKSVVIVGHTTFKDIMGEVGRPLPGILTIVLTKTPWPGIQVVEDRNIILYQPNIQAALELAKAFSWFIGREELFIIGGAQTFTAILPYVDRVYLTRIHIDVPGELRMPLGWLDDFKLDMSRHGTWPVERTSELEYSFRQYNRKLM